jgi:hypothetical protein
MVCAGDAASLAEGFASCLGTAQICMTRLLSVDQHHHTTDFCPDTSLLAIADIHGDIAVWATIIRALCDQAPVELNRNTVSSQKVVTAAAQLAYAASRCVGTNPALPDYFTLWVAELMGSKPVALDFLSALVRSPVCAYIWPSFGLKVLGDTPRLMLCQCLERLLEHAEPSMWGMFRSGGHSPCHAASRY